MLHFDLLSLWQIRGWAVGAGKICIPENWLKFPLKLLQSEQLLKWQNFTGSGKFISSYFNSLFSFFKKGKSQILRCEDLMLFFDTRDIKLSILNILPLFNIWRRHVGFWGHLSPFWRQKLIEKITDESLVAAPYLLPATAPAGSRRCVGWPGEPGAQVQTRNESRHHSGDKSRAAPWKRKRRRRKTCFTRELQTLGDKTGAAQKKLQ